MQTWILGLLTVLPAVAFSDVNLRDASFIRNENDLTLAATRRTYESRSLWRGLFGFGWCAEFEKSLQLVSDHQALLKSCEKSKAVDIRKTGFLFEVIGTGLSFNSSGQLVRLGNESLYYNSSGRLTRIENGKSSVRLIYSAKSGALEKITQAQRYWLYQIENGNLLSVTRPLGQKIEYTYDDVHNLIEIRDGQFWQKIFYDKESDQVQSSFTSEGCFEIYQYAKKSELTFEASISWACRHKPLRKKTLLFLAKRTPQGSLSLWKIQTSEDFHESKHLP